MGALTTVVETTGECTEHSDSTCPAYYVILVPCAASAARYRSSALYASLGGMFSLGFHFTVRRRWTRRPCNVWPAVLTARSNLNFMLPAAFDGSAR